MPAMRPAVVDATPEPTPAFAEPVQAEAPMVPPAAEPPVMMSHAAVAPEAAPVMRPAMLDAARQAGGGIRGLFQKATGLGIGGMMRRTLPEAQAPMQHAAPTIRVEPSVGATPVAAPARPAAPRAAQQDEMGLEIPTFLRRQSN
jgi:cell division protein FtsZ